MPPAAAPRATPPPTAVRGAGGYPAGAATAAPQGTVYGGGYGGGYGAGETTMAVPPSPLENSGSLTGHILAQGWSDTPAKNRGNTKAVLIMLVVLVAMVGLGLMAALAAGEGINSLFDGLLNP